MSDVNPCSICQFHSQISYITLFTKHNNNYAVTIYTHSRYFFESIRPKQTNRILKFHIFLQNYTIEFHYLFIKN